MVPANVMLIKENKVVYQNKYVGKLVNSFKEPGIQDTDESFDMTECFMDRHLFKLRLPSLTTKSKLNSSTTSNKDMISLADIVAHDEFLAVSQQFEARVSQTSAKRIFTITKQPITLADQECSLLVIHEQTEFFQLEKVREHNEGIRFANQCVVHQIMGPLKMIYEYVDILLAKMDGVSPDSLIFLEAIKSCSQKI
jgi:hypothetical protein